MLLKVSMPVIIFPLCTTTWSNYRPVADRIFKTSELSPKGVCMLQ